MDLRYSGVFSITLDEPGEPLIGPSEPVQGSYYFIKVLGEPCRMKAGFACRVYPSWSANIQDTFIAYYWVKIGFFWPKYAQIIPIPSWAKSWYFAVEFWPGRVPSAEPEIAIYYP